MSENFDYGYGAPAPATPQTSGKATASLILSILGLTLLPTIGSIIGLILGYSAKKEIEASGGALGGEGAARWGIILGWVGVALLALICCIVVVLLLLGPAVGGVFENITNNLGY